VIPGRRIRRCAGGRQRSRRRQVLFAAGGRYAGAAQVQAGSPAGSTRRVGVKAGVAGLNGGGEARTAGGIRNGIGRWYRQVPSVAAGGRRRRVARWRVEGGYGGAGR